MYKTQDEAWVSEPPNDLKLTRHRWFVFQLDAQRCYTISDLEDLPETMHSSVLNGVALMIIGSR